MFKRTEIAWGIDLGHRSLKAVKLQNQGGTAIVEHFECVEIEGMAPDMDATERNRYIRLALGKLLESVKIRKNEKVAIAIPGRSAFNRTIPLPPVEVKRIPDIVKYEAQQLIPFPIDEVIWDYQRLGGEDAQEEMEVTLFAIKTQIIDAFIANLKASKLESDFVQVAPLSLYNFVQYDKELEGSTIVVDVGAENADLVLLDGDRFWNRPLPYSGNDVTKALQEKFQISFEEAEELKVNASDSKQVDKLFNVMRPVLGDIVSEIHRSIGYYKSQSRNVRFNQMILLGNSFKLKGMKDFFAQHLDYNVKMFDELGRIEVGSEINEEAFQSELCSCGVALGLGLQGLGLGPITINMLPREERLQRLINKKKPYGIGIAAIFGLMVGTSFISNSGTKSDLEKSIKKAPKEINQSKADEKKYKELLAKAKPLEKDIKKIANLGVGREYWPLIFNQLEQVIPAENHWIQSLRTVSPDEVLAAESGVAMGRRGGAGPKRRAKRKKSKAPKGTGIELVIDILLPDEVAKGEIVASVNRKGGIEKNLQSVPIFENIVRSVEDTPVEVNVGLLRETKRLAGEKDDVKPIQNRKVRRGQRAQALKGRPEDPLKQTRSNVVYMEELSFLRFKFLWIVPSSVELHGTEAWWNVVISMVNDYIESGQFQLAMDSLWNYQITSPDFGSKKLKMKIVDLLVTLEPKLHGLSQHKTCLRLIERLDRKRLPKKEARAKSLNVGSLN